MEKKNQTKRKEVLKDGENNMAKGMWCFSLAQMVKLELFMYKAGPLR